MKFTREWAALTAAIIAVGTLLSMPGVVEQIIWKFDPAIIGAFLLGDYPIRWVMGLRTKRTFISFTRFSEMGSAPPKWTRLALASCWFVIIVIAIGDLASFVVLFIDKIYAGTLPWFITTLWSFAGSLWLSIDFRDHYRKDMDAENDYWEDNLP